LHGDLLAEPRSTLAPFELAHNGGGDPTTAFDLTPNGGGNLTSLTSQIIRTSPTQGFINSTAPYAANMSMLGNHTVIYSVNDAAGNTAIASRIVAVIFETDQEASIGSNPIVAVTVSAAAAVLVLALLLFVLTRSEKTSTDADSVGWVQQNPTFSMDDLENGSESLQITWRVAGKMSRQEAETEIRSMNTVNPQGYFLLRESKSASSESSRPVLSVCITEDAKMRHHRVTIDAAGTFSLNGKDVSTGPTFTNLNQFISFLGSEDPAAAAYNVGCRLNLAATYSPPSRAPAPRTDTVISQEALYTESDPNQPKVYDALAEQKSQRRAKAIGEKAKARNSNPEPPPRRLSSVSFDDFELDPADNINQPRHPGRSEPRLHNINQPRQTARKLQTTTYATAFDSDEDHDYINNAAARDVPPAYTTLLSGVRGVYAPGSTDEDGSAAPAGATAYSLYTGSTPLQPDSTCGPARHDYINNAAARDAMHDVPGTTTMPSSPAGRPVSKNSMYENTNASGAVPPLPPDSDDGDEGDYHDNYDAFQGGTDDDAGDLNV
jgi:hypothetical protein